MDVDSYIAKYGPEWKRLESAVAGGSRALSRRSGPEIQEAIRLYLRASSHLSEAQTRYGDPPLEAYLNGLVARAHATIYSARPATLPGLLRLFGSRYRAAIRRTAPFILVVSALLMAVTIATDLWIAHSKEAQAGLFPDIVRETIRRAGGARPDLGIAPAGLSTVILTNNVTVAFLAFALGVTLGVGTLYVVLQNAVLLGALGGAFAAAGRAGVFWGLILPHGLLELTAICISAGAGLRIGWSIVDPGDRSRTVALAEEARDAVMVVVGVIPAFVAAALIEGFVTGNTASTGAEIALGAAVSAAYLAFLFGFPKRMGSRKRKTGPIFTNVPGT